MRHALDILRDHGVEVFERRGASVLRHPWEARDAYIDVILDRRSIDDCCSIDHRRSHDDGRSHDDRRSLDDGRTAADLHGDRCVSSAVSDLVKSALCLRHDDDGRSRVLRRYRPWLRLRRRVFERRRLRQQWRGIDLHFRYLQHTGELLLERRRL